MEKKPDLLLDIFICKWWVLVLLLQCWCMKQTRWVPMKKVLLGLKSQLSPSIYHSAPVSIVAVFIGIWQGQARAFAIPSILGNKNKMDLSTFQRVVCSTSMNNASAKGESYSWCSPVIIEVFHPNLYQSHEAISLPATFHVMRLLTSCLLWQGIVYNCCLFCAGWDGSSCHSANEQD